MVSKKISVVKQNCSKDTYCMLLVSKNAQMEKQRFVDRNSILP